MRQLSRSGAILGVFAVLALGLHTALAASNAVPRSRAGIGSRAVSGYTVSNVRYTLSAADPTRFGTIRFRLSATPRETFARFPASSPTWTKCSLAGRNATCALAAPVPVAAATSLEVAAGS